MCLTTSLLTACVLAWTSNGTVSAQSLSSADALAFETGNTLFVGDAKAGLVHAFDWTMDSDAAPRLSILHGPDGQHAL